MNPLWSPLRSAFAAAGLVLCLAACHRAAPSTDGAARSRPPPAPTSRPAPASLPITHEAPVRAPAPPSASSLAAPSVVVAPDAGFLVALSESDPRAALLAATKQDLGPSATYLRGNFLQLWAERDFTAALAYADELRPGPEREAMLARLALVLAKSLPAEAADIVARDMRPGETRDEAAISVVHRWALADPAAAESWASAFPPGPLRERALREIAGTLERFQ